MKQKPILLILIASILILPILTSSVNAQTINLQDGIVKYYTLDSNNNTLYDLVNNSEAINNNGVSQTGVFNNGISNSGNNNIELSDTNGINYENGFTLSFWYKPLTSSGFGTIFGSSANNADRFLRLETTSGLEYYIFYDGTAIARSHDTVNHEFTIDLFEHYTLTYNTTHFNYYVNGVNERSIAHSGNAEYTIDLFGASGFQQSSNGVYDEIMIYNRALNDDEIFFIYEEQPLNNPSARFPFETLEPTEPIINETNITTGSDTANLTYEVDLNGIENITLITEYGTGTNTQNTTPIFIENNGDYKIIITDLTHDETYNYETKAYYQDNNMTIASGNFTTQNINYTNDFLIGKRYKGNSRDNLFKYDLNNAEYVEYETLNFITGTNRFWWSYNEEVLLYIDRNPDVSYNIVLLNITDFKLIEEILIPESQFTNPSGLSISGNKAFIGVENRIYTLNLDTLTGTYSTPYSSFSNDINIIETDETHVYFTRKITGGMWKFEKNNINMSFTSANSFSTSTPKEIMLNNNEIFILGTNEVRLFTKDNNLVFNTTQNNDNYVVGSLRYDELRNKYYYSTQGTLGICASYNLYEVDPTTGVIENILTIDFEESVCVNPFIKGFENTNDILYLSGSIDGESVLRLYSVDELELLDTINTPYRLDQIELIGELEVIFTEPTILGMPPVKELNQNELYSLNLFDYFDFAENINLSIYSQNPSDVFTENFSFNGIYNTDFAQFEYEQLTGEFNYLSKLLDYDVTFKVTGCNEFGCVHDLFRIETFIVPLGLEKSFPNIIIGTNKFRYSFIDDYINEEEKNITNIKLYDENLNLTIINYDYIASENYLNQYYSITMSEDVNGRTFIYYESFEEEYETNITITLTDSDGLQINDTYKLIISDNLPTQIKSIKNPEMGYNEEYTLKLNEHFNDFTAVFFGWYETDALEYKVLTPNEEYTTSYAEFSYVNNTIKIISFEEEYNDLGIPATIQACNTNGCTETQELLFIINDETFFEKTFGWLFPPAEQLTGGQKTLRVLITIAFLLLMVIVLGVQSPEARPYLVPIGTMIVLLAIITFTLMSYLSLVLIITLIFVGVLIGVGLVRRVLIGSNGD